MSQQAAYLFTEVINNKNISRKALGIAKNYFTNALKNDARSVVFPPYPYIFSKSLSSLCPRGQSFRIPKHAENGQIVHEVELGVMLKRGGRHVNKKDWINDIAGYFLLLDYTDSKLLKGAVEKGHPWFFAKAQDNFLVLSDIIPAEQIEDPHNVELELKVNGVTKQKDNTGNMHYKIHDQLDYIQRYINLEAGDILLTGTPEGIGPVSEGDHIEATLTYNGQTLAAIKDTIQKERE